MSMAYQQFIQAMAGCLCGFLLAASYDIYRVLFPGRKAHDPRRFAGDLLWWCFAFFGTFILLFFLTWGELRFFFLLFMALGFFLWRNFCSRMFRRFLQTVGGGLIAALLWLLNLVEKVLTILLWPLFLLFRVIYHFVILLCFLIGKIWQGFYFLLRLIRALLRRLLRFFFPPKPPAEE